MNGASLPVPDSKVFDTDIGCPLYWQEIKTQEVWKAVLRATCAGCVVDLGAGHGITARACLASDIPWIGLCWNQVHAHWLNNVIDRWALEEITRKKSPLHEQSLANLVNTHFSDELQQIRDRDQFQKEDSESDDDDVDGDDLVEKFFNPASQIPVAPA